MVTEVLYVRVPLTLKIELQRIADEHGVSLARVTARAMELYLSGTCGVELTDVFGSLP